MVNVTKLPGTASFISYGWVVILGGVSYMGTKNSMLLWLFAYNKHTDMFTGVVSWHYRQCNENECSHCVELLTLPMFKQTVLPFHSDPYLQSVLHIVRSHFQHSCWQCSGSSLHLASARWQWLVWSCLLLESSPHHSHLLFYAPTGSLVVQFQWLGWWMLLGCQEQRPLSHMGEW